MLLRFLQSLCQIQRYTVAMDADAADAAKQHSRLNNEMHMRAIGSWVKTEGIA